MFSLQYDLQTPYIPYRNVIDYEHVPYTKYSTVDIPNYSVYRPLDRYDKWPTWYKAYSHMPEFRHYLNNTLMRDCGNMLGLQYEPRYGILDYSRYVSIDIPKYKIDKPLDYYDKWPAYYQVLTPIPEFRTYLNNLLLRDLRLREHQYTHTYW